MLNINQKIEEFVRSLEESEDDETKNRMRAALRIGARTAIECILLESYPTKADIERVLKTLDEAHGADAQVKLELVQPVPTVYAEDIPPAPLVVDRDVNVDQTMPAAPLADEPSF